MSAPQEGAPARSRWRFAIFAIGVLLALLGVWNVVDGVSALARGGFVVADADRVFALDVLGWGWVLLTLGIVEIVAGIALFVGARWARMVAIAVAGLNGVVQLGFLAAYPVGAILIMVLSALVIWAVVAHGDAALV